MDIVNYNTKEETRFRKPDKRKQPVKPGGRFRGFIPVDFPAFRCYIINMDGQPKKSGWKIWVYLTPLYILAAIPLVKWTIKVNSGDVALSREEYGAFNSAEGELKKNATGQYNPDLNDSGYSVRYRSGKGGDEGITPADSGARASAGATGAADAARQAAAAGKPEQRQQSKFASGNQAALESDQTRVKEQMGFGQQKGYLSYAVGKVMNNPKAVGALLNNSYVVNGFMSRGTVKNATGSAQGLANYLKSSGPANFLNNPVVQAAMNNPAIVSAVASSGMVSAMLNTPAAQQLMNDPEALANLVKDNPQLVQLAMQNPQTMTTLMGNPAVSGIVGKFDTSKIKY